jgi:toxin secretion/phage lysis holin
LSRYEFVYRGIAALFGAVMGYLFGGWSPLVSLLVTFVVIDYVTGMLAGAYTGQLSSKVGYRGIAKKVMLFSIVAVAHLIDSAIHFNIVMTATIYFYLSNELLSILENAGRTGLPVPDQIKNAVSILKGKGDKK